MVVAVGETTFDPLTATEAPLRVALVAFVEDQVSVELPAGRDGGGIGGDRSCSEHAAGV